MNSDVGDIKISTKSLNEIIISCIPNLNSNHKEEFMKKRAIVSASVILSGVLFLNGFMYAQNPGERVIEVKNPYMSSVDASSFNRIERNIGTKKARIPQKSEAESVPVNISLVYDKESYYPDCLFFHDNNNPEGGVYVELPYGEDNFTVMVPKGSYWVNFIYMRCIADPLPAIHIIKEDVTIDNETSMTFDAAEAVNLITFKPVLQNGEEAVADLIDIDWNIIETGNIKGGTLISTSLYEENTGEFSDIYGSSPGRQDIDGTIINYDANFDILINPVSHRFTFTQVRIMATQDGNPVVVNAGSYLDKSIALSNNPQDYKLVENSFSPSLNNDPNKKMFDYGVSYCSGFDGKILGQLSKGSINFTSPEMYVGLSDISSFTKNTSSFVLLRYYEIRDDNNYRSPEVGLTTAPYTNVGNRYNVFNYCDGTFFAGIFNGTESDPYPPFHPNPVYSRYAYQCEPVYGNTVPFVSFVPMMTYANDAPMGFSPNFTFGFVGMNGEVRDSDKYAATLDVRYNGTSVCESMTEVNGWSWGWFTDGANKGVYDIAVIDENVKVADMTCRNETEIHFDNSNVSDFLPPLLTWMQYRDKSDFVTTSMTEKEGARLFFSAGDFEFHCNEDWHMWFTCRDVAPEVKVEYAPHGSDEFSELTVTARPDDFMMPGFGFQYEVGLDRVSRKAPGGWFDLRISLADEAGNYQTQMMSPAFRLEDQSGIASVRDDLYGVRVAGRDIIAPENAIIYGTDGIRTNGKGVEPGIYIVRSGQQAVKICVK